MTLDEWLRTTGTSEAAFGRSIGRTQTAVNRYRRHLRMPDADDLRAIADRTGNAVMPNDFVFGTAGEKGGNNVIDLHTADVPASTPAAHREDVPLPVVARGGAPR